jgi:hypothetical protein
MPRDEPNKAVRLSSAGVLLAAILLTGCAETMVSGDAGCSSYGEARLLMPRDVPLTGKWGEWTADLDDRMTGACR